MNRQHDIKWQKRFEASKMTLRIDRLMSIIICCGGIAVILAVTFIFVFILQEILPLFRGASVRELRTVEVPAGDFHEIGVDEWTERPFLVRDDGGLVFLNLTDDSAPEIPPLDFLDQVQITAMHYVPESQTLVYGTSEGTFYLVEVQYRSVFADGARTTAYELEVSEAYSMGAGSFPIVGLAYGGGAEEKVLVAIVETESGKEVRVSTLVQEETLMGKGEIELGKQLDLTADLTDPPVQVLVSRNGRDILVRDARGSLTYFRHQRSTLERQQQFEPFPGPDVQVASMDFLFGDTTLILTSSRGEMIGYSLYMHEAGKNLWGHTRSFESFDESHGADFFAHSLRNKGFLIGHGSYVSLRYATTGMIRWERDLPYAPRLAAVSSKYDHILLLDEHSHLHLLRLIDPHPEAGFAAYFSKLWYEGNPKEEYKWQSSGANDAFEPKLSMIPLIIGTLKGTIYAMLFAVPIGLLGALYVSQFQKPFFKLYIKPTMEIMASLPSVVLGFLGALWLAPIMETRVPTFLLFILLMPVVAIGFGVAWSSLPRKIRRFCPDGYEFIAMLPLVLLTAVAAWLLGPLFERIFFVVEGEGGRMIADFRLWWPHFTGERFEQRNALVVGFMMGFAVIPIIFTITEDALSNVPRDLTSGALALGATRWQTAFKIVLPTASAGIFSAVMIGLGRAVGETMIVLMATGNTPLLDFNIFSGMRTLSANIAVELPEAPQNGTLYRTLFLGAFLLFLFTFIINTVAEVLRQHLRDKYKTV